MMATALVTKASQLARPVPVFPPIETPAGVAFPRGRISEIHGAASSGRTTLLYSVLAEATARGRESCALIDVDNAFDPGSAAAAGVDLHRLLWVRCAANVGHAMRVTDMLLQGNGFGLVALDMAGIDARSANKIPLNYWYRFRRTVEQTRTAMIVLSPMPNVRQCASLVVEPRRDSVSWTGTPGCSQLLTEVSFRFVPRKPAGVEEGHALAAAVL